jgi:hypothetical protein
VVIFGCPTRPDGRVSPALRRRLERGLDAARQDPDAVVIVTGGAIAGPAEAPVMRAWLVARGLDPERVTVEDQARSTIENALLVTPMLRDLEVDRVTLVTSRFHVRRAAVLLRLALRRAKLPSVRVEVHSAPDGPSDGKRVTAAIEAAKLAGNLLLFPLWRTDRR